MTDVLANAPQAGWYDDPLSGERYRWWDGETWTGKVATKYIEPADAVAPPVVTPTVEHDLDAAFDAAFDAEPVAAVFVEEPADEVAAAEPIVAEEPAAVEEFAAADEFVAVEEFVAAEEFAAAGEPVADEPAAIEEPAAEPFVAADLIIEPVLETAVLEPAAEPIVEPAASALSAEQIAEFAAMPQFLPDADPSSPFADRWDDEPLAVAYEPARAEQADQAEDAASKLDWASFDRVVAAVAAADPADGPFEVLPSGVLDEPAFLAEPTPVAQASVAEPTETEPEFAQPVFTVHVADAIVADTAADFATDLPADAPTADRFAELLPEPTEAAPAASIVDETVPAAEAPAAEAPAAETSADTVTGPALLLAVWPLLLAATAAGSAALYLTPDMPAGVWAAPAVLPLGIAIMGVVLDRQALERREAPRAGAGWLVLTPLAYLLARAARLGAGARRRFLPVLVGAVSTVLVAAAVAGGAVLTMPDTAKLDQAAAVLQSQLSTEEAPVIVDCDQVALTIPGVPFECTSYPVDGGAESAYATIGFDGTISVG